jgi:hypothetical protein
MRKVRLALVWSDNNDTGRAIAGNIPTLRYGTPRHHP